MEGLVTPLQDRLEEWKKTANQLDKDHAKGEQPASTNYGIDPFFLMDSNWSSCGLWLVLRRIQALSSGNQKEVVGHHQTPEKSKKRWEEKKKCLKNLLTNGPVVELLMTFQTLILMNCARPLVPGLHRRFVLNWCHLECSARHDNSNQIKMPGTVSEAPLQLWMIYPPLPS